MGGADEAGGEEGEVDGAGADLGVVPVREDAEQQGVGRPEEEGKGDDGGGGEGDGGGGEDGAGRAGRIQLTFRCSLIVGPEDGAGWGSVPATLP